MDKAQDIARIVEDTITALGIELWGVDYAPRANSSLVRLYIDHREREVTVEDCEAVSREVSALFDVNDPVRGQYTLEVSSPGLDRPFFKVHQLVRFIGETVEVSLHAPLDGRRRLTGSIVAVDGDRVALNAGGEPLQFEFPQAAKVRLKPDWEKLFKQSEGSRLSANSPGDKR